MTPLQTPFTLESANFVQGGGLAVIPTDTLYGLVASTERPRAIERLYALRGRDLDKPCIILLHDREELAHFGVKPNHYQERFLQAVWPGPVSVILPTPFAEDYLHRGGQTLAFRVPDWEALRDWLRETGPILAPSANRQGEKPAATVAEAKAMFGSAIEWYLDGGELRSGPSTLIQLSEFHWTLLRQGVGTLPEELSLTYDPSENNERETTRSAP